MGILHGKRGLIMGVANEKSAAWGVAAMAAEQGADLAFTYQIEGFRKRLAPLAASVGSDFLIACDVAEETAAQETFAAIRTRWDTLDFVVHAIPVC